MVFTMYSKCKFSSFASSTNKFFQTGLYARFLEALRGVWLLHVLLYQVPGDTRDAGWEITHPVGHISDIQSLVTLAVDIITVFS